MKRIAAQFFLDMVKHAGAKKKCPRCGHMNHADAGKCSNCGYVFESAKTAAACPLPTKDLKSNTINRNKAIKAQHIQYGPINLSDKSYWVRLAKHWKTSVQAAMKSKCGNCAAFDVSPRMQECMPGMVQEDGHLGYCHMHHFKCHSARSCYTWAAGGPITKDKVSLSWQQKTKTAMIGRLFRKKSPSQQGSKVVEEVRRAVSASKKNRPKASVPEAVTEFLLPPSTNKRRQSLLAELERYKKGK